MNNRASKKLMQKMLAIHFFYVHLPPCFERNAIELYLISCFIVCYGAVQVLSSNEV